MELRGEGVNFDNLWSGEGMPFGGSLIMMALDIVIYGLIAYYLDCVIPSEHGIKRSPFFCFKPSFWCSRKPTHNTVIHLVFKFDKLKSRFDRYL